MYLVVDMGDIVVHPFRPGLSVNFEALSTSRESREYFEQVTLADVPMLYEILEFKCLDRLLEHVLSNLLELEHQGCAAHNN